MIPLVSFESEIESRRAKAEAVIAEVEAEQGVQLEIFLLKLKCSVDLEVLQNKKSEKNAKN